MVSGGFQSDAVPMLARIVIGILVTVAALFLAATAWVVAMDRQMDSGRLVERLDRTPVPDEFVLVDELSRDGTWLIKPRSPEAQRTYLIPGTVESTCARIDDFYGERDIQAIPTARSDDPNDWCGRSLQVERRTVRVRVEPIRSWTTIPPDLAGSGDLVEVSYFASR